MQALSIQRTRWGMCASKPRSQEEIEKSCNFLFPGVISAHSFRKEGTVKRAALWAITLARFERPPPPLPDSCGCFPMQPMGVKSSAISCVGQNDGMEKDNVRTCCFSSGGNGLPSAGLRCSGRLPAHSFPSDGELNTAELACGLPTAASPVRYTLACLCQARKAVVCVR